MFHYGGDGIAAADDRLAYTVHNCLGKYLGARGVALFINTHRATPKYKLRPCYLLAPRLRSVRSDVDNLLTCTDIGSTCGARLSTPHILASCYHQINWWQKARFAGKRCGGYHPRDKRDTDREPAGF